MVSVRKINPEIPRITGFYHEPNAVSRIKCAVTVILTVILVLNRAVEDWKRPPREWCEAKTQFAVMFGERFVNG
jgi:transposase-like protein